MGTGNWKISCITILSNIESFFVQLSILLFFKWQVYNYVIFLLLNSKREISFSNVLGKLLGSGNFMGLVMSLYNELMWSRVWFLTSWKTGFPWDGSLIQRSVLNDRYFKRRTRPTWELTWETNMARSMFLRKAFRGKMGGKFRKRNGILQQSFFA